MLPITDFLPQISDTLWNHSSLVLKAEPGAGKSTTLPLFLLNDSRFRHTKIIMLEPRRVAAKSIAHFMAKQLEEKIGQRVGYHVRNDRKVSSETILEIVTEGILTRRLQNDPDLADTSLIIFDEFHERSLQADLALLLSYDIQQNLREDLKLLVMSATIDTSLVSNYLGACPVIECPGRTHPVSVVYRGQTDKRYIPQAVTQEITSTLREQNQAEEHDGDILVFLPGQADIKRCISAAEALLKDNEILLLPLYGSLPLKEQERALQQDPDGRRRIIFATNIAETSLTIQGVTCVVDSGLEKQLVYDPSSGMTRLETSYISKASAEQRKGRAGRLQPGHCIRLWTEAHHKGLKDFNEEEISVADLCSLYLELAVWGESNFDEINWLSPPPPVHIQTAKETLTRLKLLQHDGKVSTLGKQAVTLGISPRLAAMILTATPAQRPLAFELAALLSERDIFYRYDSSDIAERIHAIRDYSQEKSRSLKAYPIQRQAMENLLSNARNLSKQVARQQKKQAPAHDDINTTYNDQEALTNLDQNLSELLLIAFPDRLAMRRTGSDTRYLMANGKGAYLNEKDALIGSDWLVVCDCDAQEKEARIFSAAQIELSSINQILSDQIIKETVYEYDSGKQKIIGSKQTRYGALTLNKARINDIPKDEFQNCLNQILKHSLFELISWTEKCEHWLRRASWLGEQLEEFPKISEKSLTENVEEWLLPYLSSISSVSELQQLDIYDLLLATISWEQQQLLESQAPTFYTTPSAKQVPIQYAKAQGPIVSVILQEMFGELASPKLASGKVALRFELLSPARRPIQTTSDLENFWKSSYFDVAKDMKGRYPKHRWPDDPLNEEAGRSIKKKPS